MPTLRGRRVDWQHDVIKRGTGLLIGFYDREAVAVVTRREPPGIVAFVEVLEVPVWRWPCPVEVPTHTTT